MIFTRAWSNFFIWINGSSSNWTNNTVRRLTLFGENELDVDCTFQQIRMKTGIIRESDSGKWHQIYVPGKYIEAYGNYYMNQVTIVPKVEVGNITLASPKRNSFSDDSPWATHNVRKTYTCEPVVIKDQVPYTNNANGVYGNRYPLPEQCKDYFINLPEKVELRAGENIAVSFTRGANDYTTVCFYLNSPYTDVVIDTTYPYIWRKFGTNATNDPQGYALNPAKCDGKWHLVRPFNVYRNGKWNNVEEL